MKILLLPATLRGGGTERQVVNLAKALHARGHQVVVAVPYAGEKYQPELESAGIRVVTTLRGSEPVARRHPKRFVNMVLRAVRTFQLVHREQFDVIYSFGNFVNLYASLVAMTSKTPLVWGIRDSRPGPPKGFWLAERILVRRAATAIANSQAGKKSWLKRGLPADRIVVIPNGIDMERFDINEEWRRQVRKELGVRPNQKLIGIVGRTNPVKNHELFLRAAKMIATADPDARFAIIGNSTPERETSLRSLALELGVEGSVIWTGPTNYAEKYLNALDITVSCSTTEGFSNVLVESMACGTPCVATDVGDAKLILNSFGQLVPDLDSESFAKAVFTEMSNLDREKRSRIRESVTARFSITSMVDRTEAVLQSLAAN